MSEPTEHIMKRAELLGFQANSRNSSAFSRECIQSSKERFTWELDNHGDLKCYEDAEERICSTNTVVSVEQRLGTNTLIIGCGPGGRILTLIEFDTKKQADEWEEELCKFVGQEYNRPLGFRRVRTEIKSRRDKKKLIKRTSALPDILQKKPEAAATTLMSVERTMVEPVTLQQNIEGDESWTKEVLIRSASSSSSNSSDLSQPGSLRSFNDSSFRYSSQLMEKDTSEGRYARKELMGTVLVDFKGQVCVKSSKPGSGIHVADQILAIDALSNLDARAIAEYIRTANCDKFSLRISHGVRCAISTQERGFQMNVRAGQLVQCDVQDVVRTVCHLACTTRGEISTLAVTDAINFPEETDVRKEVVEDKVQEILRETPTVIHLQPECLLRALSQLEGICIGQGVDSNGDDPGSESLPSSTLDSQIIPSSSPVEGPAAGVPEDHSSSSSTESTEVTFRNHRSRHRQRRLGTIFPDVK